MLDALPAWLYHDVPLWALVVALLTSPSRWSRWVTDAVESRVGERSEEISTSGEQT